MAASGGWRCDVTTTDYRPVSCDLHSQLELLAMHRADIRLDGERAGVGVTDLPCQVLDVQTRDGAEYLQVRTAAGERLDWRLDKLERIRLEDGRQIFVRSGI